MEKIILSAHAKINLTLRITGKRPDGYHDIISFMQGTGLHDMVEIKKCSRNATKYKLPHCTINDVVVYLCTDTKTIPTDMDNLAFRGVKALSDACIREGRGLAEMPEELIVTIDKELPVTAGIAGGSANAAACILGLNALLRYPFSLRELMSIGAGVGADVPFSLFMNAYRNADTLEGLPGLDEASDSAWTSGIGDIVERAESVPRHVILANPGVAVSTAIAYRAMDHVGYSDIDEDSARQLFVNDMEKFTLVAQPRAAELKSFMEDSLHAEEVLMSGSGPTIVAYYRDEKSAEADMAVMNEKIKEDPAIRAWITATGL